MSKRQNKVHNISDQEIGNSGDRETPFIRPADGNEGQFMSRKDTSVQQQQKPVPASLLTITQVASVLGLSRTTVYALIAREGLPVVSFGRAMRIRPVALEQWLIQREQNLTA